MDPYTPPGMNQPPSAGEDARAGAQRVLKTPATILLILTFLSALAFPAAVMGQFTKKTAENRTFLDSYEEQADKADADKSEAFRSGQRFGELVSKIVAFGLWTVSIPIQLFGFWRMRQGRSYRLSQAAAILACIPCFSGCCGIMLPFGIWSLVKMNQPDVKESMAAA